MINGTLKTYSFRVRLPSGRTGLTGILSENYTTAVELANFLYPGMVLTVPNLDGASVEPERVPLNG